MAMSAELRSKFAVLYRKWWRLHMSETFSSETKTPNHTIKQTNQDLLIIIFCNVPKMIKCTFSASILRQYMYIGVCCKDKKDLFVRLTLLSTITTTDRSGQLFTRILFFSSKLHFLINLKWTNAYAYKTNMIQVVDWLWIEEKHQNNQINTQQGKKSGTFLTVNGASENLD